MDVYGEEDTGCEEGGWNEVLGFSELFPVCRVEDGVPFFAFGGRGGGGLWSEG